MKENNRKIIVLFDGICMLCNSAVYILNKKLKNDHYDFIPSQSEKGESIISKYNLGKISEDSVVVLNKDKILIKSKAIMFLLKDMPYNWRILRFFNFLPDTILDFFYDIIAKYRHLIFIRKNEGVSCHHEIK